MSIAPGWYKDPADPTTQRWWDGEGWVGDPLPADVTPPPGPPPASAPPDAGGEPSAENDRPDAQYPQVPATAEPSAEPPGADQPGVQPPPAGPVGVLTPPGWPYRRPVPIQAPARPHGHALATLGARLVARLVDIGIVFALNVVVNGWFVYQFWTEISPTISEAWRAGLAGNTSPELPEVGDQAGNLLMVIMFLAAALWFAYEVPAISNTGQTVGKRLLRIKVVRLEKNEPLGFGRSFRRWNPMGVPILLWWCFGIGFVLQLVDLLFALFDRPLQQALHDKSAHTAVVSVASGPTPANSTEETSDEPADSP